MGNIGPADGHYWTVLDSPPIPTDQKAGVRVPPSALRSAATSDFAVAVTAAKGAIIAPEQLIDCVGRFLAKLGGAQWPPVRTWRALRLCGRAGPAGGRRRGRRGRRRFVSRTCPIPPASRRSLRSREAAARRRGVECVVLPGGPGEVPGVYGEVGGQLYDVLLPGGIAEGQVHGPLEGSRLRHRRVCLLYRGRQQSRPRRGVVAHEVASNRSPTCSIVRPSNSGGTQRCSYSR